MKNMTRQIAAILLAATVSAGALTACGGPQGGAGETEPEEIFEIYRKQAECLLDCGVDYITSNRLE